MSIEMRVNLFRSLALLLLTTSTVFVPVVESASVILTKQCFDFGEEITVRFIDVVGEGIFLGLYPDGDVPNRQMLPPLESPSLMEWILSCGRRDNCDGWPSSGLVELPSDELREGDYIIAISGNRSGLVPQAVTGSFRVGDCSSLFTPPEPIQILDPSPPMLAPVPAPTSEPIQIRQTPRPTPIPEPVQNPQDFLLVVSDDIHSVINDARMQIEDLIRFDADLTGKFLRLTFHDCIGGCDGCVDMANPDNAGLDKPILILERIANDFIDRGLTRTDIWMLAGLVATETAVPPDDRDILFDLEWVGRKTCEDMGDCGVDFNGNPTVCTPMRGPHVEQAHATLGTRSMQSFFEDEFNFTPQQVTALMGAHSVGRMSRENSGFSGRWDLSSTSFDGGYWIELIGQPPDFSLEDVDNRDIPGMPNRRQWGGIVRGTSRITMLHTDIALVRNLDDMRNGNANCDFSGPRACSQDTPFMPFARRYNADPRSWLFDFRDVFTTLIDHGHEKAGDCPPGRICTFGFGSQLSTEAIARPSNGSPTRGSSTFIGEGGTTIFLDKTCFNRGETIVVNFDNISGENVWVGIFHLDDAPDFRNIPAGPESQSDLLKEWLLSCGHRSCHTWMPSGGFQFPTNQLEDDEYIIVISGDEGSLEGQAGVSFTLGGC